VGTGRHRKIKERLLAQHENQDGQRTLDRSEHNENGSGTEKSQRLGVLRSDLGAKLTSGGSDSGTDTRRKTGTAEPVSAHNNLTDIWEPRRRRTQPNKIKIRSSARKKGKINIKLKIQKSIFTLKSSKNIRITEDTVLSLLFNY
jgi:hypothetical protein